MEQEQIEIGKLYDRLVAEGRERAVRGKYELVRCDGIEVMTHGMGYAEVMCVSRHRTSKHLVRLDVDCPAGKRSVMVTTDHVCMVYNRDRFF